MKTLLLVSHAPSPNTQRLVFEMVNAMNNLECDDISLISTPAFNTSIEQVTNCDAIILFTPENLGYMSGALKDFFDRIYYPCLELKQGLPMALIVRAGHDGTGTVRAVTTICTGLKWSFAQQPLVCKGPWDETFIEQCNELACTIAASLDCGII